MRKYLLGLTIIMLVLTLLLATATSAAPANQATITAIEDTYINRTEPDTSYNGDMLFLQQNLSGDFETDKVALIKFDLSGITFPITKVRLNLAVVNGPSNLGCANSHQASHIYVYAAGDGWNESSTWNSVGGLALQGTLKDDIDGPYTPPTILRWTDEDGLATGLATYLEQERNTSNHIASLWIQIGGNGNKQVVFEDRELSGSSVCAGVALAPTLQLADSVQPLAVNMSSFAAAASRPMWPLAVLAVIVIVGGVTIYRRRAAVRA